MVESSGLLNRRRPLKSTGGSNPPLSARLHLFRCVNTRVLAGHSSFLSQHANPAIVLGSN